MRTLNEVEKAIVRTVATRPRYTVTWSEIHSTCYPSWHTHPRKALEDAFWFLKDEGIIADEGAYYTTTWTEDDIARGVSRCDVN